MKSMSSFVRKAVMLGVAAAGTIGLAVPGVASADISSTQIQICNVDSTSKVAYLVGPNQNNDWVTSPKTPTIAANGGCYAMHDWWWQNGQSVEVHWQSPGKSWTWEPFYVSRDHGKAWCSLWIHPSDPDYSCH